ncbi:MAG: DUF6232 family protein [Pseudomonadota bacterium]
MALDRQSLDMTGARSGQLFEHTLQMGDETVTLANIATMAIETQQFQPYDMPQNRLRQRVALVVSSFAFVAGVLCFAWWGLSAADLMSSIAATSLVLTAGFVALLGRALWLSHKINQVQDYYRLSIGASDGRTVALVDNSRPTLEQVRDVIRRKIDMRDHQTTGAFDLNTESVTVNGVPAPAPAPAAAPKPGPAPSTDTKAATAQGPSTGLEPDDVPAIIKPPASTP